ncbi:MAG: putative toxin-antitoxin system toxin component, PIN family [Deltaproteobacteria bacterium]|nr:putative toxin-antitoxin system toxin component, PIN family [Deltaproteobacteria bacterium]
MVFDTNIFISGLLFKGGIPSRLIDLAHDKKFDLFFSPEILEEIKRVSQLKFELTLHERDRLLSFIEKLGAKVYPSQEVSLIKNDWTDNRILECALEAEADYLVTGDKKHLLHLTHSFSFQIVLPTHFYKIYYTNKSSV